MTSPSANKCCCETAPQRPAATQGTRGWNLRYFAAVAALGAVWLLAYWAMMSLWGKGVTPTTMSSAANEGAARVITTAKAKSRRFINAPEG